MLNRVSVVIIRIGGNNVIYRVSSTQRSVKRGDFWFNVITISSASAFQFYTLLQIVID
jgi:hypothetical protein